MNLRDKEGYKLDDDKLIVPINVCGSFTNTTVKVGRFPFNGEIVAVSFATGAALGTGVGIDIMAGTKKVVSSSDNLNGYELKKTGLSDTSITSSIDLSVAFDNFTGSTQCSIIIYVQQKP